jgi:hypothetical protein
MYSVTRVKRRRLYLYHIMAIVLVSCLILSAIRFAINGPSVNDLVRSIMFGHDTMYERWCSEHAWLNVRRGMRGSEVEALLGPSFKTLEYSGGLEAWLYSMSPRGSDYWKRAVLLRGGIVVDLDGGFYDD